MPRKLRPHRILAGHPNHLIVRGNNRRRLFCYPTERLAYVRLLAGALPQSDVLTFGPINLAITEIWMGRTQPAQKR